MEKGILMQISKNIKSELYLVYKTVVLAFSAGTGAAMFNVLFMISLMFLVGYESMLNAFEGAWLKTTLTGAFLIFISMSSHALMFGALIFFLARKIKISAFWSFLSAGVIGSALVYFFYPEENKGDWGLLYIEAHGIAGALSAWAAWSFIERRKNTA